MSKHDDFLELIEQMEEAYETRLNDVQRALYWETLGEWDIKWVKIGFMRHYSETSKSAFFPKPGELKAAWFESDEWQDDLDRTRLETRANPPFIPDETPVDRTAPRLERPKSMSEVLNPAEKPAAKPRQISKQRPKPRSIREPIEGEWTRQRALDSLKGRKPILPGYD